MSLRVAVIVLVLALLLGALAAFLQSRPATTAPNGPTPIFDAFDLGRTATCTFVLPQQQNVAIRRSDSGGWESALLTDPTPTPDSQPDPASTTIWWPILPDRMSLLIRGLKALEGDPLEPAPPTESDLAATLTLTTDLGNTATLTLINTDLGGTARAWLDINGKTNGPWLIDAAVIAAITEPGPLTWRVPRAFPSLDPFSLSRFSITQSGATLAFARAPIGWMLEQPIAARADPQATQTLINSINALPVNQFLNDRPSFIERSASPPATTITIGERGSDQPLTLSMWGPLDPAGTIRLGALDLSQDQRAFLAIPTDGIPSIAGGPTSVLDPRATATPTSDIHTIQLIAPTGQQLATYARDAARWTILTPTNPQPVADLNNAQQLITLLARTPGLPRPWSEGNPQPTDDPAAVLTDALPDTMTVIAAAVLKGIDGGTLDIIRLGTITPADAKQPIPAAISGQVLWLYPDAQLPAALQINQQVPLIVD